MEHRTELKREIGHKSPIPLRIKDIISEVKMMKHLIQLTRLQEIRKTQQKSNQTADRKKCKNHK